MIRASSARVLGRAVVWAVAVMAGWWCGGVGFQAMDWIDREVPEVEWSLPPLGVLAAAGAVAVLVGLFGWVWRWAGRGARVVAVVVGGLGLAVVVVGWVWGGSPGFVAEAVVVEIERWSLDEVWEGASVVVWAVVPVALVGAGLGEALLGRGKWGFWLWALTGGAAHVVFSVRGLASVAVVLALTGWVGWRLVRWWGGERESPAAVGGVDGNRRRWLAAASGAVALGLGYVGCYAVLSADGVFAPAVFGLRGVKWHGWAPAGFYVEGRWQRLPMEVFLGLHTADRNWWHYEDEPRGSDRYPVTSEVRY